MKKVGYCFSVVLFLITFSACKKTVETTDLVVSIDENPKTGAVVGKVNGTSNRGSVTFKLVSTTPANAFTIDESTGDLKVGNRLLFDFETNPIIKGVVEVTNGKETKTANVTINLKNVNPEIWAGERITFSKAANADHTKAENQDRITNKVFLTRATIKGLFNIFSETTYVTSSPADTEWAFGTVANRANLTFKKWVDAIDNAPPAAVNKDMVLHIISENVYIDIKFLTWGVGDATPAGGGAFSYTRTTP